MFKHLTCSCIHISYSLPSPYVYAFYMLDLMLIVHVQIKRISYKKINLSNEILLTLYKHLTIVSICCLFVSFCLRKIC